MSLEADNDDPQQAENPLMQDHGNPNQRESTQSKTVGENDIGYAWNVQPLDTARDAFYMSEIEKNIVLELNKVRSNPETYAEQYIKPRRRYYHGSLYEPPGQIALQTVEGVRALDECVEALRKAKPTGLLHPSSGLTSAARDHASDQEKTGRTGHTGSDGSSLTQRVNRYGDWDGLIGENISYGNIDARDVVIQLLIDDGVSSRGHRQNILNGQFAKIGTAVGRHPEYRFMCVMDFAAIYSDRNNND
jgi:uncharacterized protein YkwD